MRSFDWEIRFGLALVLLSVSLYLVHYSLFQDAQHLILWTTTSIAFLPISVLFVTVIINRLLVRRETRLIMEKLNMLIGSFFSVIGTPLLRHCVDWDPRAEDLRERIRPTLDCSEKEFRRMRKGLEERTYTIQVRREELEGLLQLLTEKSDLLMRLLENPQLLEHTDFTDLLRAVFHLFDELTNRDELAELPDSDHEHLTGDIERVYGLIVREWLSYMRYLGVHYPFLYSFAVRTNPFEESSVLVTE
jgi:hypothetical protein